jgi:hypothetical protein
VILNDISKNALLRREYFDPKNNSHLDIARKFFTTNKWENTCPFFLEWPYITVPDMIKDKITRYFLFE